MPNGYKLSKIYVGQNQVRPSIRHPDTDTLAYYPLRSDFNNAYGSLGSLSTTGTNTFTSDGIANVNVCQSASGGYLRVPTVAVNISKGFTYSVWCRAGSFGSYRPHFVHTRAGTTESAKCFADVQGYDGSGTMLAYTDYPSYSRNTSVTATTSKYDLWTVTLSTSGTMTFYKNGTQVWNKATGISSNLSLGIFYLGAGWEASGYATYFSDLIIENKTRTASDVSNYYNRTRGNYGV